MSEDDLRSDSRGDVSRARWALAYVLIENTGWAYARVGRLINKDHSAIVYGYAQAAKLRANDALFAEAVELLEREL